VRPQVKKYKMENYNTPYWKDVSMNCSYLLLTGKETLSSITEKINPTVLFHKFDSSITNDELLEMIEYFGTKEEYEKCDELTKLMEVQI
jgi:hypothetical protein